MKNTTLNIFDNILIILSKPERKKIGFLIKAINSNESANKEANIINNSKPRLFSSKDR